MFFCFFSVFFLDVFGDNWRTNDGAAHLVPSLELSPGWWLSAGGSCLKKKRSPTMKDMPQTDKGTKEK